MHLDILKNVDRHRLVEISVHNLILLVCVSFLISTDQMDNASRTSKLKVSSVERKYSLTQILYNFHIKHSAKYQCFPTIIRSTVLFQLGFEILLKPSITFVSENIHIN